MCYSGHGNHSEIFDEKIQNLANYENEKYNLATNFSGGGHLSLDKKFESMRRLKNKASQNKSQPTSPHTLKPAPPIG